MELQQTSQKNIWLVDDHVLVRQGLKSILAQQTDYKVTKEFATVKDTIESLKSEHPDVVLVDLSLTDGDGLQIIDFIESNDVDTLPLVLTIHTNEHVALKAIRRGAKGFVGKDASFDELKNAIEKVLRGGEYISPSLSANIIQALRTEESSHNRLTKREHEVLELLRHENSLTEISKVLGISVKTVSTHKTRIFEKLKVKNMAEFYRKFSDSTNFSD